jgi:hypothetical protein
METTQVKRFKITGEINGDNLATVIQVLAGTIDNLTVAEVEGSPKAIRLPRKVFRGGTSPVYETRAGRIMLDFIRASQTTTAKLANAHMTSLGFAPNTGGSLLAKLAREGKVDRTGPGIYARVTNGHDD